MRDQPLRFGSGTASHAQIDPEPRVDRDLYRACPAAIRCGSMSSETPRRSPGCSRTSACLKRSGAFSTAVARRAAAPPAGRRRVSAVLARRITGGPAERCCSPARNPAVPGVSKAFLSASLSARSPTWSRARSAPAGANEVRPGAALLLGDDRAQHALDRRVERLDDRMVLVQPAAIDLDDHLRPRPVERRALQLLERVAPHLAVEMARAGQPLEPGEASTRARRAPSAPRARPDGWRARFPAASGSRCARTVTRARERRGRPRPRRRTAPGARGRAPGPGSARSRRRPTGARATARALGSSRTGRSWTSCATSVRRRPSAAAARARAAPSRAVRELLASAPARRGRADRRTDRRRPPGRTTTPRARPSRTPSMRPAPCASHTSRRPRPNRPRWPPCSGSSPSAPRRRSTAAAFDTHAVVRAAHLEAPVRAAPGPAGRASASRHAPRNAASGAPNRSSIRPRSATACGDRRIRVRDELGHDLQSGRCRPGRSSRGSTGPSTAPTRTASADISSAMTGGSVSGG